ncbi:MAG: CpaF family protein [Chloroflexaceae bacterium]|jgi:pilus assembly protein CpaF|nr:CpaF family protein [Chloroflexaceae bacterium]
MAILEKLGTVDRARLLEDYDVLHQSNPLTRLARHYRDRLLKESNLDQLVRLPTEVLRSRIDGLVNGMILEEGRVISGRDRAEVINFILDETVGLGPIESLMRDPGITEVMVNWVKRRDEDEAGYARVYVERGGFIHLAPEIWFENREHLLHIIDRIVSPLGRRVDESVPMVDARLRDGSRVNAVIRPLAVDGPLLTIRRFRRDPFTADDLVAMGALTPDMAEFLRACVVGKRNILVSGGTGSGKTTLLNVLSTFIPHHERIVTIEDAAELRFHRTHPHVARMEARPPNVEGAGEVTIRQLVKNSLRMRPDRIIVGEVRGAEALDMLQAMNTGHEGSMTTVHANSTRDAFSRLETMVMWAEGAKELPLQAIREQLVSALDIVIQQTRLPNGKRKVVSVSEVQGVRHGEVVMRDIFVFNRGLSQEGEIIGEFTATGARPRCLPKIEPVPGGLDRIFKPTYLNDTLGPHILQNEAITEIMINGPHNVWLEEKGKLRQAPEIRFRDNVHLLNVINTLIAPLDRRLDELNPTIDAALPDDERFPGGGRINAVLDPISLVGPVLTIRRFSRVPFSLDRLVEFGSMTKEMAAFLRACVRGKLNILVSGGTGSGKTTLLRAIANQIDLSHERIVTIEDTAELNLSRSDANALGLEARKPDHFGEGEVTIRDLVRNALRMRPDRLIIGEVRGAEAMDMLQAMNTGHDGSMATVHANSPRDAFNRLETLVMWAEGAKELPLAAIREQLASALNIVVQQERLPNGKRKVVGISEVQGVRHGEVVMRDIFVYHRGVDERGELVGDFTATGARPRCLPKIEPKAGGLNHLFRSTYLRDTLNSDILANPGVSEIMINGPHDVWIEEKGKLRPAPEIRFRDNQHLLNAINTIIAPVDRRLDEQHPTVDVSLPDDERFPGGGRVNAVLHPISLVGPTLTIRRFSRVPFTLDRLVEFGSMTPAMAAFLAACVKARLNMLISGGTGSGKTTLLGAVAANINLKRERLITIEDAAELRIAQPGDHVVSMETRPPDRFGEGEVTIRQLVYNAMRMRPDRIIVGEVRGAETLDMLQAMNTGHEGSLTTVHANSPSEAFSRLETMVMWAKEAESLSLPAVRRQLCVLNIVVQQGRLADGTRKIKAISEVVGMDERDQVRVEDIFRFQQRGIDAEGRVIGEHVATGYRPRALEAIAAYGIPTEGLL